MLQIFLIFLTAVIFIFVAADPTEAKSAWGEYAEERKIKMTDVLVQPKRLEHENQSK